jgi:transcriptional regulator with XRE-family HTH domain
MNRRLLQFLQAENITQSQFADILDVARGSVSHILSGRNKPGYDFMESLLLHYPNLNLDWLLTGKGKMYKDSPEEASLPQDAGLFELSEEVEAVPETKEISHILVFYTDNTFQEYHPA